MGNEVTVSTPITSSRSKMAKELEAKRKEALEKSKSKKVKEKKQPSEKELKKTENNAQALAIFGQAIKDIKITDFTNFNDYKAACEDAFNKEVDARKETEDTSDDLTPEQIKIAQKYMKSKEFKAAKENIEFNNQNHIRSLQANVDGVKKGERKDQTDAILKQQYEAKEAELKEQYEKDQITEQEYKQSAKALEKQYKDYKKENKTTNGFQRFFGKKETAADRIHSVGAKQATLETTREFMTSGTEGAVESRINPELMSKINGADYSIEDLYLIYDRNSGTDATVNYSYKKKQEGERDQLLARLNENLPEGAEEFTMKDVKELGRALGYNVEKAVDAGKVLRDMGRAAIPGLGLLPIRSTAKSLAQTADAIAKDKAVVPTGAILFGVAEGVAAGASAYTQYTRVEDRAIPTNVPISVDTLEEYNAYLDQYATKEGARLGKAIAKYYVNPHTGEFDWPQMGFALDDASGTWETIGTPCNYEEAEALLTGLESGKIKPKFTKLDPEPDPIQPVYQVTNTPVDDEREIQTHDYTVKAWDDWNTVLRNKYTCADPKKVVRYFKDKYFNEMTPEERQDKGITSSRDGFFYPVGYTWKLPDYIEIDGERCNYQDNAVPQNGRSNGSVKTIRHGATFNESYQRDSWNGYDITDESARREVTTGQPTRAAAESKIHEDAARKYPDAEVTIKP